MMFLNPKQTIDNLDFLEPNMIALDVGSGSGGFTIPLSRKLEDGKVYAVDIQEEPLSALRSKLDGERIYNVELVLADIQKGVRIADNKIDFVILSNVLFEIEDKEAVFKEVKRVLKDEGHLLVIDWKESSKIGAKELVISKEEIQLKLEELGFKLEKDFNLGNYHFGLIFRK